MFVYILEMKLDILISGTPGEHCERINKYTIVEENYHHITPS